MYVMTANVTRSPWLNDMHVDVLIENVLTTNTKVLT